MSVFSLELDPHCGGTFEEAASEAVRIAKLLDVTVEYDVNEVRHIVHPSADPVKLVAYFRKVQNTKIKYKIAVG